jgi:cholinesterase
MQLRIVNLVVAALLAPVAFALSPGSQDFDSRSLADWVVGQTVHTTSGPVNGHPASNNTNVSAYLGIPYAQPPVGSLRWQTPVAYNSTAPINGTSFVSHGSGNQEWHDTPSANIGPKGFSCMQSHPSLKAEGALNTLVNLTKAGYYVSPDVLLPSAPQSEDCLTLNVWTEPQTGEASKAVLVWIQYVYCHFYS